MAASKTSRTREVSSLVQCPHNQGTRAPSHVGASTAHGEQNRASPPKCVSPVQGRARRVAIGVDRLQAPAGARRWHACWRRAGHSTELVRGAAQSRHLSVRASLASPALGRNWRKWPRGAWRLQT